MQEGRLLFGRYAFMPNSLGLCGGPEAAALLDYCVADQADAGLDGLIRQFRRRITTCNSSPCPAASRIPSTQRSSKPTG